MSFSVPIGLVVAAMGATLAIATASDGLGGVCPGVCRLPPESGPCKAAIPRFFFDPCSGECESFTYGGCEGNANNFVTLAGCRRACPPEDDICFLPADIGPCDGICPRFFHNPCTGRCEPFEYGCCDGNANNFLTPNECQAACPLTAVGACDANCQCDDDAPCTFDSCVNGACAHDFAPYGDVAGFGGTCGPDGFVNIFDIFAVLDGFVGTFAKGCEPSNLDIANFSPIDPCLSDGQIDIIDIFAVLDAFRGTARCCTTGR